MQIAPRIFFDHSRHKIQVRNLDATLDVLALHGTERLPVYIHSKLMIVDDVFTTHGSANINTRSMQVDSELNIAHEWASVTQALRRRLWDMHTNGMGAQDDPGEAFKEWQDIIKENKDRQDEKVMGTPYAPLVEFYYGKATLKDID